MALIVAGDDDGQKRGVPARGNQAALVASAAAGRSLTEISAASGLSVSSVQRRLRRPDVVAEIRQIRDRELEENVAQFASLRRQALATLGDLLESGEDPVRVRAADTVLRTSIRFSETYSIERRIAELTETTTSALSHLQLDEGEDLASDLLDNDDIDQIDETDESRSGGDEPGSDQQGSGEPGLDVLGSVEPGGAGPGSVDAVAGSRSGVPESPSLMSSGWPSAGLGSALLASMRHSSCGYGSSVTGAWVVVPSASESEDSESMSGPGEAEDS